MEEKPTKHQKSRLGRQPWKDQSPIQQFEGITVRLHTSDFRKKREFVRAVLEAAKSQADTQWIEAKIKPNISKSLRGRPEARQRIENAGLEVINDNYRQVVAITNARMRNTEKTKALGELKLTQQRIISQVKAKLEAQFAKDELVPPAHEDTILKYVKGVRLSSLTDPGTLTLDKAKWVTKHHPSTANSILKLSDLFHGRHSIPEAILQRTAAPHLLRYLTIAYTVGPRESELLKLEWPYVDMRRREFTSRKTKNGETRVVPMTLDVFLQRYIKNVVWTLKKSSCITESLGRIPEPPLLPPVVWRGSLDCAYITCDIPLAPMRRAGVDTMTAMKIVGHKPEQMHRRYNTIQPEDLHEAAAKLQKYAANTVITLASQAQTGQAASGCNSIVGA